MLQFYKKKAQYPACCVFLFFLSYFFVFTKTYVVFGINKKTKQLSFT